MNNDPMKDQEEAAKVRYFVAGNSAMWRCLPKWETQAKQDGRWVPTGIPLTWFTDHHSDFIETDEHGTPLEHGGEVGMWKAMATLERETAALRAEVERLRGLLRELGDANGCDSKCVYDDDGMCQAHWMHERPCLAERVKAALADGESSVLLTPPPNELAKCWWFARGDMPEEQFPGDHYRMKFPDLVDRETAIAAFTKARGFAPPSSVFAM